MAKVFNDDDAGELKKVAKERRHATQRKLGAGFSEDENTVLREYWVVLDYPLAAASFDALNNRFNLATSTGSLWYRNLQTNEDNSQNPANTTTAQLVPWRDPDSQACVKVRVFNATLYNYSPCQLIPVTQDTLGGDCYVKGDPSKLIVTNPNATSSTTTSTPNPNTQSCTGQCIWTWDGSIWNLQSNTCSLFTTTTTNTTTTTTTTSTTSTSSTSTTTTTTLDPCVCGTTSTTTTSGTTTTPSPLGCNCTYPNFCGTSIGQCTRTSCIPGTQSPPNLNCTSTSFTTTTCNCNTSTTATTGTTTTTALCTGCTWFIPCNCGAQNASGSGGGSIDPVLLTFNCNSPGCLPACPSPGCLTPCSFASTSCFATTTTQACSPVCNGFCGWKCGPGNIWITDQASSGTCQTGCLGGSNLGSCTCSPPSFSCSSACCGSSAVQTPCYFQNTTSNINTTTATTTTQAQSACWQCYTTTQTTTTTPPCTSCLYACDGNGNWQKKSDNCYPCPCLPPSYSCQSPGCEVAQTFCGPTTTTTTSTTTTTTTTTSCAAAGSCAAQPPNCHYTWNATVSTCISVDGNAWNIFNNCSANCACSTPSGGPTGGPCNYQWNGSCWVFVSGSCTVDQTHNFTCAPPTFSGTFPGQTGLGICVGTMLGCCGNSTTTTSTTTTTATTTTATCSSLNCQWTCVAVNGRAGTYTWQNSSHCYDGTFYHFECNCNAPTATCDAAHVGSTGSSVCYNSSNGSCLFQCNGSTWQIVSNGCIGAHTCGPTAPCGTCSGLNNGAQCTVGCV